MKLEKISFKVQPGLGLPITKSPMRFAVDRGNGITSNAWGVHVENTGDAYVYCRDSMKGQKVSLHRSGKQHISFDEGLATQLNNSDRFMNQWREPSFTTEAIPTLRMLFPTWAIGLNEEQRQGAISAWNKNEILIKGHDKLMTVVSFVIVDDGVRLRKKDGSHPWSAIGDLPLRTGKRLYVIAGWEPERTLRVEVEKALSNISVPKILPGDVSGEPLSICLTGYTSPDSVYMVVVRVDVKA